MKRPPIEKIRKLYRADFYKTFAIELCDYIEHLEAEIGQLENSCCEDCGEEAAKTAKSLQKFVEIANEFEATDRRDDLVQEFINQRDEPVKLSPGQLRYEAERPPCYGTGDCNDGAYNHAFPKRCEGCTRPEEQENKTGKVSSKHLPDPPTRIASDWNILPYNEAGQESATEAAPVARREPVVCCQGEEDGDI